VRSGAGRDPRELLNCGSPRLPFFEGLRGIAAFVVVIFHLRLTFFEITVSDTSQHLTFLPYNLARLFVAAFDGLFCGNFAVWLFWIMSAFVLSLQFFLRTHRPPATAAHDYLEDAFWRRYPRLLLPVLASVIFAYVLLSLGLMHNLSYAHAHGWPFDLGWISRWYRLSPNLGGAVWSAVWQSFFAYRDESSYNPVVWTMEKEYLGSLFLFALLSLLGHRRSRLAAYPLIAVANFIFELHWLNAFLAGIALCDFAVSQGVLNPAQGVRSSRWRDARRSPLAAACLWLLVIVWAGLPNYRGFSYLFAGIAATALTLWSTVTQQILSSAVPMFLGRISFGLYLIHLPIICSFSCWAYLATAGSVGATAAVAWVSVATCILSVCLGNVLHVLVERPGLRFSRWLSRLAMSELRGDVFGGRPSSPYGQTRIPPDAGAQNNVTEAQSVEP